MIRAVFFDLDDTLVDAMHCHIEANEKAFDSFGISYKEVRNKTLEHDFLGLRVNDILEVIKNASGYSDKELPLKELIRKREEIFLRLVKQKVRILPGAVNAMIQAKEGTEVIAVVSSGTRKFIELALRKFDLLKYVDYIVAAEDVEKGKPNPDCYLEAFRKLPKGLEIKKEECLVVEDSYNGIKAASTAGLKTLLVPSKFNEKKTDADKTISSLEHFSLKHK